MMPVSYLRLATTPFSLCFKKTNFSETGQDRMMPILNAA